MIKILYTRDINTSLKYIYYQISKKQTNLNKDLLFKNFLLPLQHISVLIQS